MIRYVLSMAIGVIIGVVTCLIILPQKTYEGCELGWSEEQLERITNKYFEKYYE